MTQIEIQAGWHAAFPGAHIGLLQVGGVDNASPSAGLEAHKRQVEAALSQRFAGASRAGLLELETLQAYHRYYRGFDKTYHVLLQLESVVFKGKSLPQVSPLVDACFAAELETHILTASHDADLLKGLVTFDVTDGTERLTQLNGKTVTLKAGDMYMADEDGVVCSILYGQDNRTPITPATQNALYVAYVPAGISAETVQSHLETILANVRLFAPGATVQRLEVHPAGGG